MHVCNSPEREMVSVRHSTGDQAGLLMNTGLMAESVKGGMDRIQHGPFFFTAHAFRVSDPRTRSP